MHLFEPNPNIFRLLQRSIHANAFWKGTFVRCLALSDSDGQATLTVYEDFWGGGRLQDPEDLNSSQNPWSASAVIREQFDVRLTTVDAYCAEQGIDHIDLMKIDVEGHEDSVFAGMSRMLDQSPALSVVMEFTFGAYGDAEEFWGRLSALFPHRYFISDRGLAPVTSLQDLRKLATTELADILLSRAPAPGSPNAPQG
jgi:FkbM family methyltransferase